MLHVVAYDITDDRRLGRVARLCEDYGIRIEKSVFEMDLPSSTFTEFWCKLESIIDADEDSVVVYPIASRADVRTIGRISYPDLNCRIF